MNPIERAKAQAQGQVPRGGAPVVRSGPAQPVRTQPLQQQQSPAGPQGVPFHELAGQLRPEPDRRSRSPEEIQADMQRLSEGIKRQHAEKAEEAEEIKEKTNEKKEAENDAEDLRSWLADPNAEDLFSNTRYKKRVEGRIEKMEVENLILHGEVLQHVPILVQNGKSKISAVYRSVSALEDLAIKRKFYDEEGPDRFIIDRYSLMNLCIGLKALNGTEQPPHVDENGKFDDKMFDKKFNALLRKPHQLLALLVVNYIWFDERVRRLLVTEELGNG